MFHIDYREKVGERKKRGCKSEMSIGCLCMCTNWGSNPQAFSTQDSAPTHWTTSARADCFFLIEIEKVISDYKLKSGNFENISTYLILIDKDKWAQRHHMAYLMSQTSFVFR